MAPSTLEIQTVDNFSTSVMHEKNTKLLQNDKWAMALQTCGENLDELS